jgi:hypothetical protein
MKKQAADIGYACHAQHSDNMSLSLQWQKDGQLTQWEKEKPFAVRDQREKEERRRRGEVEEAKQQFDLWSAFPPVINPVPAPVSYDLHRHHPLLPPQPSSAPSSTSITAAASSAAILRQHARRLLEQTSSYDPYAASSLPFMKPTPSHFTSLYHSTSPDLNSQKVSLIRHPFSSYSHTAQYKGRNHRWTEERLFFRGYKVKADGDGPEPVVSELRDLLFDAPLYSSFALDGVYREPKKRRGKKQVNPTKIDTPRMRTRQEEEGKEQEDERQRIADGECEESEDSGEEKGRGDGADRSAGSLVKVEVRSSGVYIPRAVTGRFISTHQYAATAHKKPQS